MVETVGGKQKPEDLLTVTIASHREKETEIERERDGKKDRESERK